MNFNYNQVLTLNKTVENLEIHKSNCLLCEANIHCLIDEFHLFQFQNSSTYVNAKITPSTIIKII